MATFFGDDGACVVYTSNYLAGYIYGLQFTLAEACTATSLSVIAFDDGAEQPFRICLFADNGSNDPAVLKGVTAEIAIANEDTTQDMVSGDITPVALATGKYFLCVWFAATSSGVAIGKGANTGGDYGGYFAKAYHATDSPGDITSWTDLTTGTWRIKCNYTVAATFTPQAIIV